MYIEEGMGAFFRGLPVPLLSITAIRTVSFSIYRNTKLWTADAGYFATERLRDKAVLGALGGFASGLLISAVACPLELIKINSQLEKSIASVPAAAAMLMSQRSSWRALRALDDAPDGAGDVEDGTCARPLLRLSDPHAARHCGHRHVLWPRRCVPGGD